ncbi:MAG: acetyl-CoA decarbonylase/synthase complex subunit delta [Candidatus Omnitrophica bacterium]|nr:acetyl-CoA decarbonylase/synthase complex subunit delta [Candidatus Omnitrophota bacterium]
MAIELVKEKYGNAINIVEIGRAGSSSIKIGGETTLPFLFREGSMPNEPVAALEILDSDPVDWPDILREPFGEAIKDPVKWAKTAVEKFGSRLLCVRLQSVHPDYGNRSSGESVSVLKAIVKEIKVPLIVIGCGDDEKDSDLLPKASQALKGENCLFGIATQENYKTLTATCLADGHSIISESPIDVNIAKQVNILISDMGFDSKRIVMHTTMTALGYGMEYVYSIMERSRLAAFMGDKMLSMPFILFVGQETWKVKEAKELGLRQGVNWEIATSVSMLQAGADILVVRHPDSAKAITNYIKEMMKEEGK